jgi:hypothetical protein
VLTGSPPILLSATNSLTLPFHFPQIMVFLPIAIVSGYAGLTPPYTISHRLKYEFRIESIRQIACC